MYYAKIIGYVTISRFDHYGEPAVPTGRSRTRSDGEVEAEFWMVHCTHGTDRRQWFTKQDIQT